MPKRCAYVLCKSDTRYPKRLEGEVKFFPFPKPKTQGEKCRAWIRQCGRPHSQLNVDRINKNTYICSKHFVNGRPTPEYPNPIAAHPELDLRREHQGACWTSPIKEEPEPQTQQEASTSNSTVNTFYSTSQQSGSSYEEHDMGDHKEDLKPLKEELAYQEQDILNLKIEIKTEDD
ncbi:uncharacterized protein LOC556846 [Danio rerio]|uniref:Si:ch73-311h14.2 n=1 Tax=Danio rerio TaxID=7955 RepID=A0A0R4ITJ7_DANRE|nr:uncharacterized protein LOC556846 [Danio rerio]|eukprot:NP_001268902.1 uncharacterized protein LOC556846 [Danio rerio]